MKRTYSFDEILYYVLFGIALFALSTVVLNLVIIGEADEDRAKWGFGTIIALWVGRDYGREGRGR